MSDGGPSFLRSRRTQTSTTFDPGIEAVPPHLGEKPLAAHDLTPVSDEVVEQPELSVREVGGSPVDTCAAPVEVELERSGADDLLLLAAAGVSREGGPSEKHLDARHELTHREGLAEIVVCSELETEDAIQLFVLGGQENDRKRLGLGAQLPAELPPVHARYEDVQDRKIGKLLAKRVPGLRTVGVGIDAIPLALQREGDGLADVLLVVDDRDELGTRLLHVLVSPSRRV